MTDKSQIDNVKPEQKLINDTTADDMQVNPVIGNTNVSRILVHFGATKYNPGLVKPVKNGWVKPKGGLWTSPANSEWGWKDWCESVRFRDCNDEKSFKLLLNNDAKIFIIDSFIDLKNAPLFEYKMGGNYKKMYLDFEILAKTYDAIWLTVRGQSDTHLSYPIDLYGWDCESVLIMNPYCCCEVS